MIHGLRKCVVKNGDCSQEISCLNPYVGQKVVIKEPDSSGTWEVVDILKEGSKMIDYENYTHFVRNLVSPNSSKSFHAELETAALGLVGEAGEVADHVKKILFHELEFTDDVRRKMLLECGDVLWYVAFTASALHVPLQDLFEEEIDLPTQNFEQDLRCYSLKVASYAGRIADLLNKVVDGDCVEILDERQDVKFLVFYNLSKMSKYMVTLISVLGSSLKEVIEMNIDKLSKRYKNGTFSKKEFLDKENSK